MLYSCRDATNKEQDDQEPAAANAVGNGAAVEAKEGKSLSQRQKRKAAKQEKAASAQANKAEGKATVLKAAQQAKKSSIKAADQASAPDAEQPADEVDGNDDDDGRSAPMVHIAA